MIKLMLGYYPVMSGSISIAGRNINEYNLKWWRRHCGVVMQDGVIFSESIARNIAVDDGGIDVDRLEKAARIANIHDYVMSLPLKYNTIIGRDGVGLSQGQKQRILIARAVYKIRISSFSMKRQTRSMQRMSVPLSKTLMSSTKDVLLW